MLVSCGTDVRLHSTTDYRLAHIYQPSTDAAATVRSISLCRDGSWLVLAAGPNGSAEVVRAREDVKLLHTVQGIPEPSAVAFQRTTKKMVAVGTESGAIVLYDIKGRVVRKKFCGGSHQQAGGGVTLLDWSLRDSHVAAAGPAMGPQVQLYSNTTNQKVSQTTIPASRSISALRFGRIQRSDLGLASDEGAVSIWDITSGKHRFWQQAHRAPVTDVVFSGRNHSLLVSCGLDRTCLCYDTGQSETVVTIGVDQPLSSADLADGGGILALGTTRGVIYIYDLRQYSSPINTIHAHSGEVRRLLYQPVVTGTTQESDTLDTVHNVEVESAPRTLSVDSFSQILNSIMDISHPSNSQPMSASPADSFLAELANTKGCNSYSEQSQRQLQADQTKPSSSTPRNNRLSFVQHQQLTEGAGISPITPSTPAPPNTIQNTVLPNTNQNTVPPNTTQNTTPILQNTEELRSLVEATVTRVVSEQIADLRDDLSRHFLNLQLNFTKQFICQEKNIDTLALHARGAALPGLVDQLERMRQENSFLQAKITELLKEKK